MRYDATAATAATPSTASAVDLPWCRPITGRSHLRLSRSTEPFGIIDFDLLPLAANLVQLGEVLAGERESRAGGVLAQVGRGRGPAAAGKRTA